MKTRTSSATSSWVERGRESSKAMTSTQEELIRHRIEKRMSGRRDLILHAIVYVLVMVLIRVSVPWWDLRAMSIFGALWAIPLALNALRYYYQCGPGLLKRADAIDQELDRYAEFNEFDDEEAELIEDRVAKKFKARRIVAGHLLVMVSALAILWFERFVSGIRLELAYYRPRICSISPKSGESRAWRIGCVSISCMDADRPDARSRSKTRSSANGTSRGDAGASVSRFSKSRMMNPPRLSISNAFRKGSHWSQTTAS